MSLRGIRGAITVEADRPELIIEATKELLKAILVSNPTLALEDIASVFFTTTSDLRSVYPARAAREIGWTAVPLMCLQEMPVENSLPLCIRVLIHWNTHQRQDAVRHVYLRKAVNLRPDLAVSQADLTD